MSIIIIAEAGVNHNGSMELACKMIDAAAKGGADFVKFQTVASVDNLTATDAPLAAYQKQNMASEAPATQKQMLRKLMLPLEQYAALARECGRRGIGFLSTPFDIESVAYLAGLGVPMMKVPSGEVTDLPYLRAVGATGLPVVMSTGMCTLADIENALEALYMAGTPEGAVTLLHCNTQYPTPYADVNLRAMHTLAQAFGTSVGYSDHTPGTEVAIAAAALGATIIEKHFTLSREMPGPDHAASLEPDELRDMVSAVRHIELALGSAAKHITPSERANAAVARRSIVARRRIEAGATITADDLAAKRPGTGISPMRWDEVVGRTAKRAFNPDELIEL